jgi:hypothetical protein
MAMKSIGNITLVRENAIPQTNAAHVKTETAERTNFLKPMVFKSGEVIRGTVLESLGANTFLLELPSGTLEAHIDGQFRPGAELMLRVLSSDGKLLLKAFGIPVSPKNAPFADITKMLGINASEENLIVLKEIAQGKSVLEFDSVKEIFTALKNFSAKFPHISMQEMIRILVQMQSSGVPLNENSFKKLGNFFRLEGNSFSALLKKTEPGALREILLKSFGTSPDLLIFLRQILEDPEKYSEQFLKEIREVADVFEAKEIVNLYAASQGLPLYVMLFLAVENEFYLLKMRIKKEGKKGKRQATIFSFLLNLPTLGELEIDGSFAEKKLSANVTASPETIKKLEV